MIFLFKYLPRSLGVQLQNYLQQVLPAIIDGLADENESVRDAAHGAGHVLVEYFATMIFASASSFCGGRHFQ
nr:eIF-2-alpha kinase activator GCN1 isoform X17 [Ipomoea batatas]